MCPRFSGPIAIQPAPGRGWAWPKTFGLLAAAALLSGLRAGAADVIWVEDSVPSGAWTGAAGGDQWQWTNANPAPFSGQAAHHSSPAAGIHYHYFSGAASPLVVNPGEILLAYVHLDPANPPREIMCQWFDGASWSHAAYWGENLIHWGINGTASQQPMGGLPPAGQWVRLEVPAHRVNLEGRALYGMNFILYDGKAAWDHAGKATTSTQPPPDTEPPAVAITAPAHNASVSGSSATVSASASDNVAVAGVQFQLDGQNLGAEDTASPFSISWDTTAHPDGSYTLTAVARDAAGNQSGSAPVTVTVRNATANPPVIWVEDSVPTGASTAAYGGDQWKWVSRNPSPYSGTRAHQSALASGTHYHYFYGARHTLQVGAGDTLLAYIWMDPANPPNQIMLQWYDGSWAHSAYWGTRWISVGTDGTPSQQPMGLLPPAGGWVRLEVPARLVGLEGRTITGMNFALHGGRATWDYAGKQAWPHDSWLADAGRPHYADLLTLPPRDLQIENDSATGRKLLRFSNWIVNRGTGPLEVVPVHNTDGTIDGFQRIFSHDSNGNWHVQMTRFAGKFIFHPEHDHWHFEDFAHYQLRNSAADGSIGNSILAESTKVSFCLLDSAMAEPGLSHAQKQGYAKCSRTEPQGLSVGWVDVYTWDLPDQDLDITHVPDGNYWLKSTADPANRLDEGGGAAEINNSATIKIRIQGSSVTAVE